MEMTLSEEMSCTMSITPASCFHFSHVLVHFGFWTISSSTDAIELKIHIWKYLDE